MFRLTREVRFAVNPGSNPTAANPTNSFAGFPTLSAIGQYYCLEVTLNGAPDPGTGCLLNIKDIDHAVRESAIPAATRFIASGKNDPAELAQEMFRCLKDRWPKALHQMRLWLTPFLSLSIRDEGIPMIQLSQKFEFCASHRLHNPAMDETQNRQVFGKCNNPHGHGHNYVLQVTLALAAGQSSPVARLPQFEKIVADAVIDRFDHKNLNVEIPEFRDLIPTVENIAMVIYRLLKPKFDSAAKLASVTVWETSKTWCEYSE